METWFFVPDSLLNNAKYQGLMELTAFHTLEWISSLSLVADASCAITSVLLILRF